jgi:hypothetical protein
MSSITPSDRSKQTDELRNQREEYQGREAEEVKKHKREMRRLNQKHDQEVENLKKNYEGQMQNLRERSSEQLSEKDQQNIAKVDELRSLYTESLKKRNDETQNKRDAEKEAIQGQIAKQRQINDQQRAMLKQNFDNTISEKSREFEGYSAHARNELQEGLDRRTDQLTKKHQTEVKAISQDRDTQLAQSERNMKETRSVYENKLKDQDLQHNLEMDRTESNWKNTYTSKERELNELVTGRGAELNFAREKMQNHYNKALEKKMDEIEGARLTLKEQAVARIDRDVRSAESENHRIKNDHLVEVMTTKRLRDLEKNHVVMDYEDRMEKLTKSKDGLIEKSKEVNRDRITEAVRKNEAVLSEATRRSKTDQLMSNERHKEDRDRLEIEHRSKVRHISDRTDDRVDKLMKTTNESQRVQLRQHSDNINALKNSYQGELSNQREAQMEQLKDTYIRMEDRLRNSEEKHTKRLEETVGNYESKISQMQEQFKKDLQRQSETYEGRMNSQKKRMEQDSKTHEMKIDGKVSQLQDQHEKEVDRLERRHQEQMASLAQKLNYYRKNT